MAKHVVLIMTDQQRRDTIAAYGGTHGATPNLDAFAREATVFERAYCATPLCVPTRTAMYTGMLPHRNGVVVNGWTPGEEPYARLKPGIETLYEHLAGHGFNLTHIGVDHCRSVPPIYERVPEMHYVSDKHYHDHLKQKGLERPDMSWTRAPCADWENGRLITIPFTTPRPGRFPYPAEDFKDFFWAREAEKAISELDPEKPQFIETLFWAPHVPLVAPEPYYSMFKPEDIELPETVGCWYKGQAPSLMYHIPGHFGAFYTREEWRKPWAAYLALVRMVDECIGRVLAALKKQGIWDDALAIFNVDHGDMMGSHGLFQKMCMYEEAAHVALMMKPPGGRKVERAGGLASHIDIVPTICDLLETPPLSDGDGSSLRPMLEGAAGNVRDEVFIEYNGNSGRGFETRCLVSANWKYIYNKGDRDELYNLATDPNETHSLTDAPEYREKHKELRRRLAAFMKETGDRIEIEP